MATATAIAIRRDAALQRLTAAIAGIKGGDVDSFVAPKQAELREAALIEWAASELESATGESAPVEVAPDDMPKWYQRLRDKAHEDGITISPLYEGETQASWTERTESEPDATVAEDVAADAESKGTELDTAVTKDGDTVVATKSGDAEKAKR